MNALKSLGDITASLPATYHHDASARELTIRLHKPVPAYEPAEAPKGAVYIPSRLRAWRLGRSLDVSFMNYPKPVKIGKTKIKKIQTIEVLVTNLSNFEELCDGGRIGFAYRGATKRTRGRAKRS